MAVKLVTSDDVASLCESLFSMPPESGGVNKDNLKLLANTLLLKPESRQQFVDTGYVKQIVLICQNDQDAMTEAVCLRILFLVTYNTSFDYAALLNEAVLPGIIIAKISKYAKQLHIRHTDGLSETNQSRLADTVVSEALKLLFNLTQFYPTKRHLFYDTITDLWSIIDSLWSKENPLRPPVNLCINALLNLSLGETVETTDESQRASEVLFFPESQPARHIDTLLDVTESLVDSLVVEQLQDVSLPLFTLIRRLFEIAPSSIALGMRSKLLPGDSDRQTPLGDTQSLPSKLLQMTRNSVALQLKDAILGLLYELCDKDPQNFIESIGYGNAVGYLMNHNLSISPIHETDAKKDFSDQNQANPITGQWRAAEKKSDLPEMTIEEKEREAERLFVLFERLKATGIVDIVNPVEQATREGRIHEIPE